MQAPQPPRSFRDLSPETLNKLKEMNRKATLSEREINRATDNFGEQHKEVMKSLGRWQWSQRRQMTQKWARIIAKRGHLAVHQGFVPVNFLTRFVLIVLMICAIIAFFIGAVFVVGWIAVNILIALFQGLF